MAKVKKEAKTVPSKWSSGGVALLGVFVVAAISAYYPFPPIDLLVLALLGAYMAMRNVQIGEEVKFIIGVVGLVLINFVLAPLTPDVLARFLTNLTIGFGAAGLLVSLGLLVKLGWRY